MILFLTFLGCASKESVIVWKKSIYKMSSQSSPRAADLNQDGIKDIILGAGESELMPIDNGIIAFDGVSGDIIWQQKAPGQIVGSGLLIDVNEDEVSDIIIGGRGSYLSALNGTDGDVIWQFSVVDTTDSILRYAKYNFFNSVLVPDSDQDELPDILTINGGNYDAAPNEMQDRYPGVLLLLSSADGSVIAADTMPDGLESYMTPIYEPKTQQLLFGTGGETFGGNLYTVFLEDFISQGISDAKIIFTDTAQGFIAPPVLADINNDDVPEAIGSSHAGHTYAIDLTNGLIMWDTVFQGLECSSAFAVGNFSDDKIPDIVAVFCRGKWPTYHGAHQFVLNGATGTVIFETELGCISIGSPVVFDFNRDGFDEFVYSSNEFDCSFTFSDDTLTPPDIANRLVCVDVFNNRIQQIDRSRDFRNFFSTPLLDDLDNDGYLDIVYVQNYAGDHIYVNHGFQLKRISSSFKFRQGPVWGGYLGNQGNGIY